MNELGDKLNQDQKDKIQQKVNELKEALKTGGTTDINTKIEELRKVVQEAGAAVYQQAAQQQAQQQAKQGYEPSPPSDKESRKKTVDAEYKVVDEDKDNR
jgi:molecular chaperone DnaK